MQNSKPEQFENELAKINNNEIPESVSIAGNLLIENEQVEKRCFIEAMKKMNNDISKNEVKVIDTFFLARREETISITIIARKLFTIQKFIQRFELEKQFFRGVSE